MCTAGVTQFRQIFQNFILKVNALKPEFVSDLSNLNTGSANASKQDGIVYSKDFIRTIEGAFDQLSYTIYHVIKKELDTFAKIREMSPDDQGKEFVKQMWEKNDFYPFGHDDFRFERYNDFLVYLFEKMEPQNNAISENKKIIKDYWEHFKTQYPKAVIRGNNYEKLKLLLQVVATTLKYGDSDSDEDYTLIEATDASTITEITTFLDSIGAVQQGGKRVAIGKRASSRKF